MTPPAGYRIRLLMVIAVAVAVLLICLSLLRQGNEKTGPVGKGIDPPGRKEHTPPPANAPPLPPPAPSLAELTSNPRALDPDPLALDFGAPPFERQSDGTIPKRDVMAMTTSLNSENQECEADLDTLRQVVGHYFRIFRQNPVAGENREVIAALTGENQHQLVFLDPAHPALNEHRELLDRWGTPFRFHPVSGSLMEFSSAGPDGTFGTPDDVLLDEEDSNPDQLTRDINPSP